MQIRQHLPAASRTRLTAAALLPLAIALAVAGCGSSSPSSTTQQHKVHGSGAPSSARVAVTTTKVPGYGTVLAGADKAPLYLLTADPSGGSSCAAACAKQWPPLTSQGSPGAGAGVNAALLSSFRRSDGSRQVLYNGHALYTHPGTSATAAAGTAADGGIWYLVSPGGKPIKSTNGSGY